MAMGIQIHSPADRLITDRIQVIYATIDTGPEPFALSARCGDRDIPFLECDEPSNIAGTVKRSFIGYLVLQEVLALARNGYLRVEFSCGHASFGPIDLRISPLSMYLAEAYPLNVTTYRVGRQVQRHADASPPRTLVFPGIRGTGGASLRELMRLQMFREGWWASTIESRQRGGKDAQLSPRVRWIQGHNCYHVTRALQRPYARITILREPLTRLLSVYNYNSLVHPFEFRFASFEEFILSGGAREFSQVVELLRCTGNEIDIRMPDDELKSLVDHELDQNYSLVGITELYEETLFLTALLGQYESIGMWWRVLSAPRAMRIEDLTPEMRRELERQLAADLGVYHERRSAFCDRVADSDLGPDFARYKRDSMEQPDLPDRYKIVECLRWRQVMAEWELAELRARRESVRV
jgi:hypothetical protein